MKLLPQSALLFVIFALPACASQAASTSDIFYSIENIDPQTYEISARERKFFQLVGSITFTSEPNKIGVIFQLRVAKSLQNRGIGSQLMIRCLRKSYANKTPQIVWLATNESISFYSHLGAQIMALAANEQEMFNPTHDQTMYYNFDKMGDPEKHLKKYYSLKTKVLKQI